MSKRKLSVLLAIALIVSIILSVTACTKGGNTSGNNAEPSQSSSTSTNSGTMVFKHPGILQTEEQLKYMKSVINGKDDHPMKQAYEAFSKDLFAKAEYVPKAFAEVEVIASGGCESEDRFRHDAHAAYANALQWVITGDAKYKDTSIRILNEWASTFKKIFIQDQKKYQQPTLEASWAVPIWVSAAEIIRYYDNGSAGWSESDIKKFEEFVRAMIKYVNGPCASAENWKASRALSRMAAGVFLNDENMYKSGYSEIKINIVKIGADGKPSENTRDFVHAQYNVIATSQGAEIAFNQGDDSLYLLRKTDESEDVKPLLWRQSEYFTGQVIGKIPEGGIDYSADRGKKQPPYEMVLSRYKYNFNMPMPNTEELVTKYGRPVDVSENHFVGWTTLTHGDLNLGSNK